MYTFSFLLNFSKKKKYMLKLNNTIKILIRFILDI